MVGCALPSSQYSFRHPPVRLPRVVLPSLPVALPSLRCTDSVDLLLFVSMFFLGAESGPMVWITLPGVATLKLGTVEEHTLFLCVLSWIYKIWNQC